MPASLLLVLSATPVREFSSLNSTPGTIAPLESTTLPLNEALVPCAIAEAGQRKSRQIKTHDIVFM
jgi:hypothetical protein